MVETVLELRQYTLRPGRREVLVELFDREFVEPQEALGLRVVGQFRDLDAPDRFVWVRGFADLATRLAGLTAFYGGPVWAEHGPLANTTMLDVDDVLLLRPVGAGFPPTTRPDHPPAAVPAGSPAAVPAAPPTAVPARPPAAPPAAVPARPPAAVPTAPPAAVPTRPPAAVPTAPPAAVPAAPPAAVPTAPPAGVRAEPSRADPAWVAAGPPTGGPAVVTATVYPVSDVAAEDELLDFLHDRVDPVLTEAGRHPVADLRTLTAVNDYPALPVRAGEHVVVRFARYGSAAEHAAYIERLAGSAAWPRLRAGLTERLAGPPQRLRLQPTPRSALR